MAACLLVRFYENTSESESNQGKLGVINEYPENDAESDVGDAGESDGPSDDSFESAVALSP